MNDSWFDPNTFGMWAGAVLGGGGGMLCGLWGAMAGTLAPRGKAKALVMGLGVLLACSGAIMLGVGIYALIVGQPYAVYYPLMLAGGVIAVVCGALVPVIKKRYAEAEARRFAAESFRQQ